ncbi:MAG: hypothetical protein LBV17_01095 [Treponema sp.]|jgi:hypothetical protein|nr:hypothetical protein [Treponema sp.]
MMILENIRVNSANFEEGIMKNFVKVFGIIALVAVIGFSMAACGDGPSPKGNHDDDKEGTDRPPSQTDVFAGTWVGTVEGQSLTVVASNGTWNASMMETEVYRGTYTVSGNDVTIKFTQVNTGFLSVGVSQWKAYNELTDEEKEMLPGESVIGTITGNQWNMAGVIFTKQ